MHRSGSGLSGEERSGNEKREKNDKAEKAVVMKSPVLLVLVFGALALVSTVLADAKVPIASAMLTEKDAVALVGGPLGEVFRNEEAPEMSNGYDHSSTCGFFPKGYKIQEADRPPERGLMVQLHAMRNNAEAKSFYEHALEGKKEMSQRKDSPLAGDVIVPLKGMGDDAFLQSSKVEPEPKALYQIATITFLKGSVMGQVMVWKKAASADEIAKTATKKVISKLR